MLRKLFKKIKRRFGFHPSSLICSTDSHYSEKYPRAVTIGQIKEKFASLRVYYDGGDERVKGMIALAENICDITCQSTGSRNGVYTNISGWVSILDPKVAKKIKKARGIQ